jgi:hypothetical protein
MRRWEYRIVSLYNAGESMVEKANTHGADGWELVAVDRQENWIFKRPLEEETLRPHIPSTMTAAGTKKKPAPLLENGAHVREPAPARRTGRRQLS